MMRLLIACNGSASAEAAIDDLGRAGLPRDAEVRVLAIGEPQVVPSRSSAAAVTDAGLGRETTLATKALSRVTSMGEEARDLASIVRARLQSAFPGWRVRAEDLRGRMPDTLIEAADDWGADLIVVGSEPRTKLGGFFPENVSRRVAAACGSSVRLARRTARRDDGPPRILVGVDDSPGALGAVFAVASRVWPKGTAVRIVAVKGGRLLSLLARFFPDCAWAAATDRDAAARAPRIGQWAGGALRALGLKATVARIMGDPRRALVDEARRWGADCIYVGARSSLGDDPSARLGRVAKAVLANAHCSVEVVHLDDVDRHAPAC